MGSVWLVVSIGVPFRVPFTIVSASFGLLKLDLNLKTLAR